MITTILFAGDFCVRGPAEKYMYEEKIAEIAAPIRRITEGCDFSVVNVETVFSDKQTPIAKSGPNLKSPMGALRLLKEFGFQIAACANNHMGDFGEDALLDTMQHLQGIGMQTVGAGKNEEKANAVGYFTKNGVTLAVVNCAEHEFGFALGDKPGVAAMDYDATGRLIKKAKENSDAVIVYIHGGNEHNPLPRPGMKKLCRHFADCGAAAVIVAHSHCPQGIERYNGTPIAYGLGNFYMSKADYRGNMWPYGYMAKLSLSDDQPIKLEIIPYYQDPGGEYIKVLSKEERARFTAYLDYISSLMHAPHYPLYWLAWCAMYMEHAPKVFDRTKGVNDELVLYLRNSYSCESHNELMTDYYRALCDGNLNGLEKYKEEITKLQHGRWGENGIGMPEVFL